MEPTTQPSSPAIPIAIVCGFTMIAIAIFFTNKNDSSSVAQTATEDGTEMTEQAPRAVTEADYIRGNPNAPILMIEYSDYDCPFCKQYHATLNQIMDEYGITGKVAWAYRQFPLAELHPNSPKISEAALCVGKIGGNESFWKFTDAVYNSRDVDEATNITKLPDLAETAGVSKEEYLSCMDSKEMEEKVMKDIKDGFNAGARGTPYTILIVGGQQAVINGSQPYDVVKGIVQNLIDQLDGTFDPATAEVSDVKKNEQGVPVLD
ncbi:MAG: thioredoxin domain-containing protein [Candidatus Pacebacteria bacterium]|nr:thioredoxin domain-containing protein [Candidatus Paceibacterota bacterium]